MMMRTTHSQKNDLQIQLHSGSESFEFEVNKDNELLMQKQKLGLDLSQKSVKAHIHGKGCVVLQSILRYVTFDLARTILLNKL